MAVEGPPRARTRALVLSLAWLVMIAVANTGATAVAQPEILGHFGVRPVDVGWIVFGYAATFAISTAWYGAIARRVGAAPALAFGASLLGVAAIVSAMAPRFDVLLGSRLVQGLGAGAIATLAFTIVSERLEGRDRGRAIGTIVGGVGIGQAVGPLLGGVLIDLVSWRGAVAVGALALPVALAVPRLHTGSRNGDIHVDVRGGVLLAVLIAAGIWLLNRAPVLGPSPLVVAVAVAVAALVLLWRWHVRRTPEAILPRRVVRRAGYRSSVVLAGLLLAVFTGVLTGIPLVLGPGSLTGVTLGLVMLPMAASIAVVSSLAHHLVRRLGTSETVTLGLVVLVVASGLAALSGGAEPVKASLGLLPVGVAYGLLATPLTERVSHLFPATDRSLALAGYNVGFFIGGAAGGSLVAALIDRAGPAPARGFAHAMLTFAVIAILATAARLATRRRQR